MKTDLLEKVSKDERKILIINLGLLQYCYITKHYNPDNCDFRKAYTDYYLRAQGKMRIVENQELYFSVMKECKENSNENICEIIMKLKDIGCDEFSFATKLLHTNNPDLPIYDSKVHDFLHTIDKTFWRKKPKTKLKTTGDSKLDNLNRKYELLKEWYDGFLKTDEGNKCIGWFKENEELIKINEIENISKIKMIDFMIFAYMS